MKLISKLILILAAFAFSLATSHAASTPSGVTKSLEMVVPGYAVNSVKQSAIKGIYEFTGDGKVLYISEDGRYIINGNIIDLESKVNLTEAAQSNLTKEIIRNYDEKKMIVFSPKGKTKHTITVFTDVDCPYCSMLHKEVPKLNEAGIAVRYLMYPRAGAGSPTFLKSVSTWCADDQQKALGVAKEGGVVEPKTCDNPVQEQFDLGSMLGVSGTPTLVLESGKILPGFVPAPQLIKMINAQ